MMMKILFFITICILIMGHVEVATETVTGITGESLMINCQYPHQTLKDTERSFCKIQDNTCAATTEAQSDLWINEERFSMYNNKSLGLMSVLIRNLTVNDRGTYKCKVDGKMILHLDLKVEHDTCCGRSESHTGYLGESVTISCKYPLKYKDYPKLLYKVQDKVLQSVIFLLGYSHTEGRFSLTDNSAETLFTVTINQVNRDDDGIYLCGLTNPNYIHLLTEIHLTVSYFHVIIIVCVSLTLLIGGLCLLLFTLRCKKTKDTISSSNQRNTRDCDELSTEVYYKTMKESETGSTTIKPSINLVNTVYATAVLPTSPSDRDFYTLAEQPKIPSDI